MNHLSYKNKFDENNNPLRYSAQELATKKSIESIKILKRYDVYNKVCEVVDERQIEIYFSKLIFNSTFSICDCIVNKAWNKKNNNHEIYGKAQITDPEYNIPLNLIAELFPKKDFDYFSFDVKYFIILIRKYYRLIRSFFLKFNFSSKKKSNNLFDKFFIKNNTFFAIKPCEDFDTTKRSDFFWINESKIDSSNFIFYFDNKGDFESKGWDKYIDFLEKKNYQWIKLWENALPNKKISSLDKLLNRIKKIKKKDNIERWIFEKVEELIKKTNFWYSFFSTYNIKISIDRTSNSEDGLFKQIAISYLDGLSINFLRSYPQNVTGTTFLGHFYSDIFFVWGQDSAKKLLKTRNIIKNIIISGCHNIVTNNAHLVKKNKKINFTVLLLDSNHSFNDNNLLHNPKKIIQLIHTPFMEKFYLAFLDLIESDKEIGLIIKPKKYKDFLKLDNVLSKINNNTIKDRCIVIENSDGTPPANFTNCSDITICTSFFFPTTLIECAIAGSKCLYFDYANIKPKEKETINLFNSKIFYNSMTEMLSDIQKFKKSDKKINIGDCSSNINKLDPYQDLNAPTRIANYIDVLFNSLKNKHNSIKSIRLTNKYYKEIYGLDKVINV